MEPHGPRTVPTTHVLVEIDDEWPAGRKRRERGKRNLLKSIWQTLSFVALAISGRAYISDSHCHGLD